MSDHKPDIIELDAEPANKQGITDVSSFAALSAQTPEPSRERVEGEAFEVADPENLPQDAKSRRRLVLASDEDEVFLSVWVADNDESRYEGLSQKEGLDERHGMLFDWGEIGMNSLVMREMSFPIDMIFLDDMGYVRDIYRDVAPDDDQPRASVARYALEVPAGFAEKYGIDESWQGFIEETADVHKENVEVVNVGAEVDKDNEVYWSNVGGDPFQDYDVLGEFCEALEDEGATVLLGDEPWDEATGHHDRPVRAFGITLEDAEEVWEEYEDDALAIGGPSSKQEQDFAVEDIVFVDNVHEAPDGVTVHATPGDETKLYYVWDDDVVERIGKYWPRTVSKDEIPDKYLDGTGLSEDDFVPNQNVQNVTEDAVDFIDEHGLPNPDNQEEGRARVNQLYDHAVNGEPLAFDYWLEIYNFHQRHRAQGNHECDESSLPAEAEDINQNEYDPCMFDPGYFSDKTWGGDAGYEQAERIVEAIEDTEGVSKLDIADHIRVWVQEPDSAPDDATLFEGDGPEGCTHYYLDTLKSMVNKAVGDDEWSAQADVFRVLPPEDGDMDFEDDIIGVGIDFPNDAVYVDWHNEAFPDELEESHVSIYGSVEDLEQATGNVVERNFPSECRECGENVRMEGSFRCPECHPDVEPEDDYTLVQNDSSSTIGVQDETVAKEGFQYPNAGGPDAAEEVQEAVQRFREEVPESTKRNTPLLYWLLGTGTPEYKMSKADADYKEEPEGEMVCANCQFWYVGSDGEGVCSKVRGEVFESHWCRLWRPDDVEDVLEDYKTKAKSVDWDVLFDELERAHKEQIWPDDLSKAPTMWQSSSDVPDFVSRWVDDVIEMTDAMWQGEFEDVPLTEENRIHQTVQESLTQPQGWSTQSIANNLQEEFDFLSQDRAETIARQEVAAVLNKAREVAYRARPDADQMVFDWVGPDDMDTTDLCTDVKEEIESFGGAVPLDQLKGILRRHAEQYEYGTENRVEEYLPHFQCRHTLMSRDLDELE